MVTELLQAEIWRKRLEDAGFRVLPEAWEAPGSRPAPRPAAPKQNPPPAPPR